MAVQNTPVGVENLKGAIDLGKQVLKSLELVNGGAVIAILTFYGNVVKDGSRVPIDPSLLSAGLRWFAFGLVLAVAAACAGYLGQLTEATSEPKVAGVNPAAEARARGDAEKLGIAIRGVAIVVAILSLSAFVRGTWLTSSSLRATSPDQTRWQVASHIGAEWTFSRRAIGEAPARRVVADCMSYHWQGHAPVMGGDVCFLPVGDGLVTPMEKLARPKLASAPVMQIITGDTLSVSDGGATQLFKIKRDEVVP